MGVEHLKILIHVQILRTNIVLMWELTHIPNFINIASLVAELLPLVDFDYENNYDKLIMGNNLAANEEIFIKFGMWVYLLRKCVEF